MRKYISKYLDIFRTIVKEITFTVFALWFSTKWINYEHSFVSHQKNFVKRFAYFYFTAWTQFLMTENPKSRIFRWTNFFVFRFYSLFSSQVYQAYIITDKLISDIYWKITLKIVLHPSLEQTVLTKSGKVDFRGLVSNGIISCNLEYQIIHSIIISVDTGNVNKLKVLGTCCWRYRLNTGT